MNSLKAEKLHHRVRFRYLPTYKMKIFKLIQTTDSKKKFDKKSGAGAYGITVVFPPLKKKKKKKKKKWICYEIRYQGKNQIPPMQLHKIEIMTTASMCK
jgi:hypothetical protein